MALHPVLSELLDEGYVLAWKQKGLWNYVKVLPYLISQLLDLFDVLFQKVLSCDLLVSQKVIDLLKEKKVTEVYLRTGPGPEQVP